MLRSLIEHVSVADDTALRALCPQDIALCNLWQRIHPEILDEFPQLPGRINAWRALDHAQPGEEGGRRRQFLLREQIAHLEEISPANMDPESVAFLCEVYDLCESNGAATTRPGEHIGPYIIHLRARAETLQLVSLDALLRRAAYLSPQDLARAPMREIRVLAGIELPFRGHVFEFEGHVRVLGDVPEHCTVVVRDGHCAIDGYLLGRVLSRHLLEVGENISGVAITLLGEIRARGIINNALVVAKLGSVRCVNAQDPKLIFAGKQLLIEEDTYLGNYTAHEILVRGRVRGGLIQVSGQAESPFFGHQGGRRLSIVLRRELTCADYGEVAGPELRKLLSEAYRLRTRAEQCEVNAAFASEKAEQLAGNALMYLFGGGAAQKHLEELAVVHRRLGAMRRVERNVRNVLDAALNRLAEIDARAAAHATGEESPDTGFYDLDEEEAQEQDIAEVNAHAHVLHARIRDAKLLRTQAVETINEAREKLASLAAECKALDVQMLQASGALGRGEHLEKLLGGDREQKRLPVLKRVLPRLKEQPMSAAAQRMQEPFAAMTLRKINRALEQVKDYTARAKAFRQDFQTVNARLGQEFQVEVIEQTAEENRVTRVTGRFDPDVEICMDYVLESEHHAIPGAVFSTPKAAAGENRTYYWTRDGVRFYSQS
jgi:hypothetical protein